MKSERPMRAKLTEGTVDKVLLKLSAPMIWGIFVVMTFNLADTFFVGQLGAQELAAMSFTFPVVMLGGTLALGLGVGTSSVIARAIGQGQRERVCRLATDGLSLALLSVSILILLGLLTMNPLFKALGAGPELLPLIKDYMTIWYIGLFFLVVPMVGNSAIRATGDTLTPSLIMTTAGVLNIILDPLLIFGLWGFPHMGLKGAALATVFARGLTLMAAVGVLHFREKLLIWQAPKLETLLSSWKAILHVGLPAAATNSLGPLANGFITALVARFGIQAVAGFGVATRLEAFSLVALMGLSAAMGPFVGQNWGAGLKSRVHQALKIGFVFALLWSLFVALVLAFWGKSLAIYFNADPAIVSVAGIYLGIVPWSFTFEGWRMISNATFNALGKPLPATAITLFKLFGLYVPLAWVGAQYYALPGIFVAIVIANVLTGIISALWIRRLSH